MEYPNSRLVSPSPRGHATAVICPDIPLRVHRNAEIADRGALRAQKDWQKHFGALPASFSGGTMGPEFNATTTCLPETLPDRLELTAYLLEIVLLVDSVVDAAESPTVALAPHAADLMQAYRVVQMGGDMDTTGCTPAATLIVDFARAMVSVDADRARQAVRWLVKWFEVFRDTPSHTVNDWQNFDQYVKFRHVNLSAQCVHPCAVHLSRR